MRDVPYFMYKRSEATCHGTVKTIYSRNGATRSSLTRLLTMSMDMIVESHTYQHLEALPMKYQLQLFLAFFQMVGYGGDDGRPPCRGAGGNRRRDSHYSGSERDASHGGEPILDTVRKNADASLDLLPRVEHWLPALEADSLDAYALRYNGSRRCSPATSSWAMAGPVPAGFMWCRHGCRLRRALPRRRLPLAPRARRACPRPWRPRVTSTTTAMTIATTCSIGCEKATPTCLPSNQGTGS